MEQGKPRIWFSHNGICWICRKICCKKLVHGKDQEHDYHPIHKISSKRAIGRSWIEEYYKYTFDNGYIVLPNGEKSKIPRYYVDWLKKHHPELYIKYAFGKRQKLQEKAEKTQRKEETEYLSQLLNYKGGKKYPKTRGKVKETILNQKFKRLQENLKL